MNAPVKQGQEAQQDYVAEFAAAMELSDVGVTHFYFNGFTFVIGPADSTILFKHNDKVVALGAVSHSVLKEFALKTLHDLSAMETMLGTPIMTSSEATEKLLAAQKKAAQP